MDLRKIKALIDLLEKSNLAELEIKEGEESVRLARHSKYAAPAAPAPSAGAHGSASGRSATSSAIALNSTMAQSSPSKNPPRKKTRNNALGRGAP